MRPWPLVTVGAVATVATAACQDETVFTAGRDPLVCADSIPTACGPMARCVLDPYHYITGRFPGATQFIVHTVGEADLRFDLELDDRLSPGTTLRLQVSEPGCVQNSIYDSAGKDIFQNTDQDGILSIPLHVYRPGDHLVQLSADAYCSYKVRYDE
jgi:hypothetical protein